MGLRCHLPGHGVGPGGKRGGGGGRDESWAEAVPQGGVDDRVEPRPRLCEPAHLIRSLSHFYGQISDGVHGDDPGSDHREPHPRRPTRTHKQSNRVPLRSDPACGDAAPLPGLLRHALYAGQPVRGGRAGLPAHRDGRRPPRRVLPVPQGGHPRSGTRAASARGLLHRKRHRKRQARGVNGRCPTGSGPTCGPGGGPGDGPSDGLGWEKAGCPWVLFRSRVRGAGSQLGSRGSRLVGPSGGSGGGAFFVGGGGAFIC
mmetsp:Transcript_50283/g.114131  ORF Transcript_50283/g.114131 Transcript_50283/m.114131 type:complete len:257 (-) Transcript_50283:848-1618(-)